MHLYFQRPPTTPVPRNVQPLWITGKWEESLREGQVKCEYLLKKEFLQILLVIILPWTMEIEEQKSSLVINYKPYGNKRKGKVAMSY